MHERAHVVDVDSQTGLETKSIDHISLVYSSATFKSIATGGNVSQALVSRQFYEDGTAFDWFKVATVHCVVGVKQILCCIPYFLL